jgi:hypothetical protein
MTSETRRRLAALFTGTAGTLTALLVATWLRQDACVDAGGRWLAAARMCELPSGASMAMSAGRAYAVGAVGGVLTAIVLWRVFTFAGRWGAPRKHHGQ